MTRHTRARPRAPRPRLAVPLTLLLVATLLGGPAFASGPRTFTADIAPAKVEGNVTESFSATLTNTSAQQQLGSANIAPDPDSDISIVGVTAAKISGSWLSVPGTVAAVAGNVLELRNLALAPGASVNVVFDADTGCVPGAGFEWEVQAKQANNFSGPPGNDLRLTGGALSYDVTSGCAVGLRFVEDHQPADAEKDATLTSARFDPDGPPVRVEAIDELGNRVESFGGDIAVALNHETSGASLGGDDEVQAVNGVADFTDLTVDTSGMGYTLEATSDEVPAASETSDPFNIYDEVCEEGSACELTMGRLQQDGLQSTAGGIGGPGGGALNVVVGGGGRECNVDYDYNELPATTTVLGDNLTDKTVEFLVSKQADQRQPNNGVAHYQVCAEPLDADSGFTDRHGNAVGLGEGENPAGLLPDCETAEDTKCVESRNKISGGRPLIVVRWGSSFRFR